MKYMGSKSRIAKDIVPIFQNIINENGITEYLEPFCGGCNIIDKIKCENKTASDIHKYLISMYKNLDKIIDMPKFITKEHYSEVRDCFNKNTGKFPDWYIGAVGFLASYNGRFFDGGYAGIVHTKAGTDRNYYDEARRNLIEQIPNLNDINFMSVSYDTYKNLSNYFIYCDPPYANTKQYGTSKNFDYDKFWEWCRNMSKNNIVIISEHTAPEDFKCIWSAPVKRTIDNSKRIDVVERLFTISKLEPEQCSTVVNKSSI